MSEDVHSKGIVKHVIIPRDIQCALDILERYKKYKLEKEACLNKDFRSLARVAQKKIGIDKLEDYLIDRAFEATIPILIEDFVYKMNMWCALSGGANEAYELYANMRDAAYDVSEYFI